MKTNPKDYSITTQVYATHSRGGNAVHINQVFSDAYNQEWLLTDNGLLKITNDKEEPVSYFVNIDQAKMNPYRPSTLFAVMVTNFILDQTEDGYGAILCRMKSFVFGNCR